MASILTHPDARLREISQPVTRFDDELHALLSELQAAMDAGPGGVGIAAPQIGEARRIVIVDCSRAQRPCKNHGRLHMINPRIEEYEGEVLGREGCLSVPDWVGMVKRARRITVCFRDASGREQRIEAKGFEARVIQHELDHLDGILFIDKVLSTHDLVRRLDTASQA